MSIVEKVAMAIKDARALPGSTPKYSPSDVDRRAARAVIEAMREPSEAMLQAAVSEFSPPGAELVAKGYWTAMISAALEER